MIKIHGFALTVPLYCDKITQSACMQGNRRYEMEVKLLTTKEVAEKLHCSTHQVAHLRQHGLIRGTRFAKYWMYSEEDINNFILKNLGQDFWHFRDLTPEAARKKYAV